MADGAGGKRSRLWPALAAVALVLVLGGLAFAYSRVEPYARIGSTYIAKQMCSCLYVAGRSEGSCRAEFKPDIDRFTVALDRAGLPERASVKTTVAAIFHGEATYTRAYGCTVAR